MSAVSSNDIAHDEASRRFSLAIAGSDDPAAVYYQIDPEGRLILTHTEVPYEASGQGIASTLAQHIFDYARHEGKQLILKCPFMAAWYAKHPEYGDVVAG